MVTRRGKAALPKKSLFEKIIDLVREKITENQGKDGDQYGPVVLPPFRRKDILRLLGQCINFVIAHDYPLLNLR
jgi:hypothetical protein